MTTVDALSEIPRPSELRYLQLAAQGMSTRAIATQLGIAPATVKNGISMAGQRYGAQDRATAILRAIAFGDITVPGVRREHPTLDERMDRIEHTLAAILDRLPALPD